LSHIGRRSDSPANKAADTWNVRYGHKARVDFRHPTSGLQWLEQVASGYLVRSKKIDQMLSGQPAQLRPLGIKQRGDGAHPSWMGALISRMQ
jgi:hypothetical protein